MSFTASIDAVLVDSDSCWHDHYIKMPYKEHILLPATTTPELVHGICVSGATSATATSNYSSPTYSSINPVSGSLQGWDDRNYDIVGMEGTPCSGGTYLKPSRVRDIPEGTPLSIDLEWTGKSPPAVCVFITATAAEESGGFPQLLTTPEMDFVDLGIVDGFGWMVNGALYPFTLLCRGTMEHRVNVTADWVSPWDGSPAGNLFLYNPSDWSRAFGFAVECTWNVVGSDQYCDGTALSHHGYSLPGLYSTKGACLRHCELNNECNFFLYRYDASAQTPYTCATFSSCDSMHNFADGNGGHIYRKGACPSLSHTFRDVIHWRDGNIHWRGDVRIWRDRPIRWTATCVGQGSLARDRVTDAEFRRRITAGCSDGVSSRLCIIRRSCPACAASHQEIYYKRKTALPPAANLDFLDLFMNNWNDYPENDMANGDFELYSTYEDAVAGESAWSFCNYNDPGIGFPRDCGPIGPVGGNWNSFERGGKNLDFAFYVEMPGPYPPVGVTSPRMAGHWQTGDQLALPVGEYEGDDCTHCVDGMCYRALENTWTKASSDISCQDYYIEMPDGWEVADYRCDILKQYGWNSHMMCFSDGQCPRTKLFTNGGAACDIYDPNIVLVQDGNSYKSSESLTRCHPKGFLFAYTLRVFVQVFHIPDLFMICFLCLLNLTILVFCSAGVMIQRPAAGFSGEGCKEAYPNPPTTSPTQSPTGSPTLSLSPTVSVMAGHIQW